MPSDPLEDAIRLLALAGVTPGDEDRARLAVFVAMPRDRADPQPATEPQLIQAPAPWGRR